MIRTGYEIPDTIEPSYYNRIYDAMVNMNPGLPSATVALPYRDVTDPLSGLVIDSGKDTSLSRQMLQLTQAPESVHPEIDTPPDAFVFTAKSAVPVAIAVREYYSRMGQKPPVMTHITMNRRLSTEIYRKFGERSGNIFSPHKNEIVRLHDQVGNSEHVAVVDQYVDSGITLKGAAMLLYGARVKRVSAVVGKWYDNTPKDKVDIEGLDVWDEEIYDLMRKIGSAAFERAQELKHKN